jgi:hypothetical protein
VLPEAPALVTAAHGSHTEDHAIRESKARLQYIRVNPFARIRLVQPESFVQHTGTADEQRLFRELYHLHPHVFLILLTERLTGLRNSDILELRRSQFNYNERMFQGIRNVKAARQEDYPISAALFLVYDRMFRQLSAGGVLE